MLKFAWAWELENTIICKDETYLLCGCVNEVSIKIVSRNVQLVSTLLVFLSLSQMCINLLPTSGIGAVVSKRELGADEVLHTTFNSDIVENMSTTTI